MHINIGSEMKVLVFMLYLYLYNMLYICFMFLCYTVYYGCLSLTVPEKSFALPYRYQSEKRWSL